MSKLTAAERKALASAIKLLTLLSAREDAFVHKATRAAKAAGGPMAARVIEQPALKIIYETMSPYIEGVVTHARGTAEQLDLVADLLAEIAGQRRT